MLLVSRSYVSGKVADFLERSGRSLNWIRLFAFFLIAVGFNLDLLVS